VNNKKNGIAERHRSRRPQRLSVLKQGEVSEHYLGTGVALGSGFGMAIGSGLGVAFGNVVLGISFGLCVGLALGIVIGSILGNKQAKAARDPSDPHDSRNA
jgi:hypothetical protein